MTEKNMNDKQIKVVVILGPTSSGKSDVAIKLAKEFDGEVISADSRQVYRDMNLGTGKVEGRWISHHPVSISSKHPSSGRRGNKNSPFSKGGVLRSKTGDLNRKIFISDGVPHHIIDFRSPRGEYNVSHFQKDCVKKIQEISLRGKLPIMCGGTGFWISAVVNGIVLPQVKPDKKLRAKLDKKTTDQLYFQLKKLDPIRAKSIDKNNKIRLIRAIEICQALGRVPRTNHSKFEIQNSKFLLIGIDWPQEKLDQKIKKRLESRWTDGMIKEVKNLKKKYGFSWKKIQSFGLAYHWIPLYIQEKLSLEELKEKVFIAERGYAKRQRTWFKRDRKIIWENDYGKIKKIVKNFIDRN